MVARMHQLGVVALLEAYLAGRVSVVAATEQYLERIAAFDPQLKAFTQVAVDGARAAAKASAQRYDAGTARPLEGVPIAIKANLDVAGLHVHGGIDAYRDRIATADCTAVERLRDAGAVILGMLNMHEAALGATTDNLFFGQCQNPHRPGYTPGGSSGGSGAAVAAGLCAAALGTDTLGSIRIPAAYCGVTGLKPTNGLVPDAGMMLLVQRLDCIGPLARSVADTAAVMAALAPLAPAQSVDRIATLSSLEAVQQEAAPRAAFALARDLLGGLGFAVSEHKVAIDHHRVRLAGFVEAARCGDALFADEIAANPQGFSPPFKSYLDFGRGMSAAALAQGREVLDAAAAEVRAVLLLADVILLPTTPQAAFPHSSDAPVSQADFTALANIAGLPALAIPAGWSDDGLPVGVQLMGRPGSEATLLALGARLEAALNAYRPPLDYQ